MFGIPIDLIVMAVSAFGGFYLKNSANNSERLHEERLAYKESVAAARNDKSGVVVRRFIVIIMMALFAFIIVAPAFMDVSTVVLEEGWFGTKQVIVEGIIYDDTIRMTITSIMGYYFGTSAAGR